MVHRPPIAPCRPVALDFHGEVVHDPYLWLENVSNPEVAAWLAAQNEHARAGLDALPSRPAFLATLGDEDTRRRVLDAPVERGGRLFYRVTGAAFAKPALHVRMGQDGAPTVLFDPATSMPGWSIDFWTPSPTGAYVACGMSPGGNERAVLYVVEVESGRLLDFARTGCAYGCVAWTGPASFAYTCFPGDGGPGRGTQVLLHHVLGEPGEDEKLLDAPGSDTVMGAVAAGGGRYILVTAGRAGWPHQVLWCDRTSGDGWRALVAGESDLYWLEDDVDGWLYMITTESAPRGRIVALPLADPEHSRWREVLPEGPEPMLNLRVLADGLALETMRDAASRLVLLDHAGGFVREIELPGLGTVGAAARAANNPVMLSGSPGSPDLFFRYSSIVSMPAVYRVDGRTGSVKPFEATPDEGPRHLTTRLWATSADGTRVPITVAHPADVAPGHDRPVLQTGYGGWGFSTTPTYNPLYRAWLDAGGVVALAHLRGGGEYGAAWHDAGRLGNKQRTFDDVHAATGSLVDAGWARAGHVVLEGTSNGGLTVAAATVQRPDAYAAVVCAVPHVDMLRAATDPRGRLGVDEYGDPVADPVAYGWIRAYSPYHHVTDGVHYPPILLTAVLDDGRVPPWHAAKMAARLQAAHPDGVTWLSVAAAGGHRAQSSREALAAGRADKLAFLWHHAGGAPKRS